LLLHPGSKKSQQSRKRSLKLCPREKRSILPSYNNKRIRNNSNLDLLLKSLPILLGLKKSQKNRK